MSRPLWQLLLLTRSADKPVELNCAECFALLEFDAELLKNGVPLEEIRSAASHHLSLCQACQTDFDEWMKRFSVHTQLPASPAPGV